MDLPTHARLDPEATGLRAILDDRVNLAVWSRRHGGPPVDTDLLGPIDDVAVELGTDRLLADLPALLADAGYPTPAIRPLAADVADLGGRLAALAGATRVAIRLEVIETDACRRFHADYIKVRLICTYAGPGTQWLENGDAVRFADGADPATLTIRQIATGDVAVFKGRHWSPDRPIVHRSPPISATGERRLVLVIDPAPDAPAVRADPMR